MLAKIDCVIHKQASEISQLNFDCLFGVFSV